METVQVRAIQDPDNADWFEMRAALWPYLEPEENRKGMQDIGDEPSRFATFLAVLPDGRAVGFVEASLRYDYVNGCDTSPVAFLEGVYVRPEHRRQGIARRLVEAAEVWGRSKGCVEIASDALVDNTDSHDMHRHLGFEETERVVYFKKRLKNS